MVTFFYFIFQPRGHDCHGREFLLYHTPANLSREKSKKSKIIIFPKTLDKSPRVCYTIDVKGRNTLGTQDFPIGLKQDFEVLKKCKTP